MVSSGAMMIRPRSLKPASQRQSTRQARRTAFDAAVEILATEFAQPIRIEEVARRVAVSPRQLQRVFADEGELGFRSYLRRVRMSHARRLLATTDLPVKEVARRVGYGNPSQFSKAFKRVHGIPPSQARLAALPVLTRSIEE
jgi:AraC family transcriptional regulator, regulatory protein of adaptative response / methylphosphotriester-DNA alkyltransferase methyltransferase